MNTLYIVAGAPGAGKTTHGKALAQKRNAALLDIDTVTEVLIQTSLSALEKDPDDRDSPFFKATFRDPIYETLFNIAAENLPFAPVVLVGPFTSEKQNPNWTEELEARFQTQVEIHYVSCEPEKLKRRIEARANPRDASKLEAWEEYVKYHDASLPLYRHTLVET